MVVVRARHGCAARHAWRRLTLAPPPACAPPPPAPSAVALLLGMMPMRSSSRIRMCDWPPTSSSVAPMPNLLRRDGGGPRRERKDAGVVGLGQGGPGGARHSSSFGAGTAILAVLPHASYGAGHKRHCDCGSLEQCMQQGAGRRPSATRAGHTCTARSRRPSAQRCAAWCRPGRRPRPPRRRWWAAAGAGGRHTRRHACHREAAGMCSDNVWQQDCRTGARQTPDRQSGRRTARHKALAGSTLPQTGRRRCGWQACTLTCAAPGSRMPPEVFSSASATRASTRSPLGMT